MKRALMISAAVLLCAAPAFAQDQPGHASPAAGTSNDTASAVKDTAGHAMASVSGDITKLADFVPAAAMSDMYEVEAGQIAEQRSHNSDVKAFAAHMVTAHTATTKKLKALLQTAGSNVTPPPNLDNRHQGMIDELRGAQDADFDHRYLSQQVDAHKEALAVMKSYARNGDVMSVKLFAQHTAPVVESHLDMAQHLYGKLK